jgi:hypothetical protein
VTIALDPIWEAFEAAVDRLNERFRPEGFGMIARVQRSSNDVFPLRALASYSASATPGDEQLVISVDFRYNGSTIVGTADLARGDGVVLDEAELPAIGRHDPAVAAGEVTAAAHAVATFVARQYDTVLSELRE